MIYQLAKSARMQLDELLGWEQGEGDWIVTSENGEPIPEIIISKIREGNPKSKVLIVTNSRRQLVVIKIRRMLASKLSSSLKCSSMRWRNQWNGTSK